MKPWFVLGTIAAGTAVVFALYSRPAHPATKGRATASPIEDTTETHPDRPSDSALAIAALERRLAALESKPAAAEARPPGPKSQPAPLARQPPSPADLDRLVDTQSRDQSWARAYEMALTTSLAADFKDDPIREAKCASSVCRVVVEHASPANAMTFVNRFWASLPDGYEGAHYEPLVGPNGERTTVLHILRRGFLRDEEQGGAQR